MTNVQFAQDSLYTFVATDTSDSVTSQPATLTVLVKPVIVQAPLSQSVVTNMILSEKQAFFTLNNVQTSNAGQYRVVTTNAALPTLTLNTTWNLTVLADADGDGLPDAWKAAHGLNSADALADSDGDGQSNLGEYRSGTSPTNAASCLKLEGVTHANGQATVSFNTVSNQTCTVEWCAQPAGATWSKLADVVACPGDRLESVTDLNASDAAPPLSEWRRKPLKNPRLRVCGGKDSRR